MPLFTFASSVGELKFASRFDFGKGCTCTISEACQAFCEWGVEGRKIKQKYHNGGYWQKQNAQSKDEPLRHLRNILARTWLLSTSLLLSMSYSAPFLLCFLAQALETADIDLGSHYSYMDISSRSTLSPSLVISITCAW